MSTHPATATLTVRKLRPADLEAVIALDAKITGRRREEFFQLKLRQALEDTGIQLSLAADAGGMLRGFLLARVYYGEFGQLERAAVLETLGVHPDFRGQGIGAALIDQLYMNLRGLGITRLDTLVDWTSQDLLAFFAHEGFVPSPRLALELRLDPTAPLRREERGG